VGCGRPESVTGPKKYSLYRFAIQNISWTGRNIIHPLAPQSRAQAETSYCPKALAIAGVCRETTDAYKGYICAPNLNASYADIVPLPAELGALPAPFRRTQITHAVILSTLGWSRKPSRTSSESTVRRRFASGNSPGVE
jgi:hypothetical protein